MSTALKGSLIIGQSGGPSSVINSSAYGVIRTALDSDCITKVYGAWPKEDLEAYLRLTEKYLKELREKAKQLGKDAE